MKTNYSKLSPKATAITLAIIWGISTFLIAIGAKIVQAIPNCRLEPGMTQVLNITNPFYIFDMSTWPGVFLTTIEAVIFWALVGLFAAWIYNKFV